MIPAMRANVGQPVRRLSEQPLPDMRKLASGQDWIEFFKPALQGGATIVEPFAARSRRLVWPIRASKQQTMTSGAASPARMRCRIGAVVIT